MGPRFRIATRSRSSLRILKLDNELRHILPIELTIKRSKNMNTLIAGSNQMVDSAMPHHLRIRKILLGCGILSALIWMGADILASLLYQGYNYPFQPISGLSTLDSPTRSFLVPLDILYTALKIAFAVGVWMTASQKRSLRIIAGLLFASGIVDLTANFYPWNPSEALGSLGNVIHGILAGGLTGMLFLLTIAFGARADGKGFRYYSYATILAIIIASTVMALFGNLRMEGNQIPAWFGLTERINGYGLMLWMLALAIILLRAKPASWSLGDRENIVVPDALPGENAHG
jgi:hypothetical protein